MDNMGKILFGITALVLAVLSAAMLFSSILLINTPELALSQDTLKAWEASAYIAFWGFILLGTLLSALNIFIFEEGLLLRYAAYYFLLPVPIFVNIYNTFFYHNWMSPVYDALHSWSGIQIGGSVWLMVLVLLCLHQLWMLGMRLSDGYDPMYCIAITTFNLLILFVFIPVTGFFGWTVQPPLLSSGAYFTLNVFIYIQYLWQRRICSGGSAISLSVFHAVFGMLVILLYAYLNSPAFTWLHYHLTTNPLFYILVLCAYGGIGYLGSTFHSNSDGGITEIQYYRPVEGKEVLEFSFFIFLVIPLVFAGTGFSSHYFFNNIASSVKEPEAAMERNIMTKLRTQSRTKFLHGKKLDKEALAATRSELDTFIKSSPSYRGKGKFRYGMGPVTDICSFETDVEMSYNGETGLYTFVLSSKDSRGYKASERKALAPYHIPDGAYYIAQKDGKNLVFSGTGADIKKVEQDRAAGLYAALMKFTMKSLVKTDFITSDRKPVHSHSYHMDGGNYIYRRYQNGSTATFSRNYDLITYKNKPVQYEFMDWQEKPELIFNSLMDFYYDDIPQDAPAAVSAEGRKKREKSGK